MSKQAAIYVRISKDPSQAEAGIKRQEADCRELADSRGWEIVRVFKDNDRSATNGKARPAWAALLNAIEAGEVNALVAYSSSRMYRRPRDLEPLLELAKARSGFAIATVKSGTIDVDTAQGRMLAGILAAIDEGEVEVMAERIARARKQRVRSGLDAGGSRPFGYEAAATGPPRVKDGKPRMQLTGAIVPREAELIREAARRLLAGESIRAILRDWNDRAETGTRGRPWTSVSLRQVLTNRRLIGLHPETGERAAWPPILDKRTHDALVRLYAEPGRLRSRRGERYLLTGLLWCGVCGERMTGRPSGRDRRYGCGAHGGRAHLSISAFRLEGHVVDRASEERPDWDEPQVADPADNAELLAQLDDVDARIASWAAEAARAGLRASDIAAGHEALAAERDELEAALAQPPAPKVSGWDQIEPETRAWLEAVIERVTVAPAAKKGRVFDPSRISIQWK